MPYVTSWERRALKQGMEEGMEEGMEQGINLGMDLGISRGELKDKRQVLCRLVEKKFGPNSTGDKFVEMVEAVSEPGVLDRGIDAVLDAEKRDAIIEILG